jgi:hypothetical protein
VAGKVLWHVTMSLDGFIAGPGDDMGWMGDYVGPNPTANDVLGQIGAVLIGARTYEPPKTEEDKVYDKCHMGICLPAVGQLHPGIWARAHWTCWGERSNSTLALT